MDNFQAHNRVWHGKSRLGKARLGSAGQGEDFILKGFPWNMFSKAKQGHQRTTQIKHIGRKSAGRPLPVMSDAKHAAIPKTLNATTSVIPGLETKF
jgi:hypothetical protein